MPERPMTTMVREICVALKAANVDAASAVGERAELATKSDLALHSAALREDVAELRVELATEVAKLRAEMHREIGAVRGEISRSGAAALLVQAGLIVALVKLIP